MRILLPALELFLVSLSCLLAFAHYRWRANSADFIARLTGDGPVSPPDRLSVVEFEGLPVPMMRYFRAVLRDGQRIVRCVRISQRGEFLLRPPARARLVNGRAEPTLWQGRFFDYEERDGMRIPLRGEVEWLLPDCPQVYLARPHHRDRAQLSRVKSNPMLNSVSELFAYRAEIRSARERVRGKSAIAKSPYGDIEYAQGGAGPAVLVIHGAGGGYDQGELIVRAVLDERFRWIAPSRFGYLRSDLRAGVTSDDQAHAYACLLDHLRVQRVAVIAVSAGGPSALLFALLYPERVSSLTLISCGVVPAATQDQRQADKKGKMLLNIFKKDLRYWIITKLFKKRLMTLMGANEAVIASLSSQQLEWAKQFIAYMNPASMRYAGAVFDNTAALPGDRIAAIRAPTLILHAEDDTLQLYHNASFAASTIPGARLLRFRTGGHFVMIIEQNIVRAAVQRHILASEVDFTKS